MREAVLDNPIWHSLATRQSGIALVYGKARRYPASSAPFAAALEATAEAARDVDALIDSGEKVGILNVIPPLDWPNAADISICQFVWPEGIHADLDPEATLLTEEHIPAMLALTALVYPAYFRAETAKLGDYVGIFRHGALAAMAGLRMAMDGYQELSAICTHPDFRGQGLAGRLTRHLAAQVRSQGDIPFLHTESDNPARGMYEKLGFRLRAQLSFQVLVKP